MILEHLARAASTMPLQAHGAVPATAGPPVESPPSTGDGILDSASRLVDGALATPAEAWLKILGAIGAALLVHVIVFRVFNRFARRTDTAVDTGFVRRISRPSLLILPLLGVQVVLPSVADLIPGQIALLRHVISLATIVGVTWLLIAAIGATAELVKSRYDVSVSDNYAARRMHTQVTVVSRVVIVLATILGVGLALMTFPRVRELGTSLLASAGIVGIIVGFAARPVLENIIAGVQLALTQPINIDDVVIVDGEWGRVEQITSTYVVVRIWDDRRLICPFSKFISESFQNWTRRTADILGTVFIHVDYTVPVAAVREALQRIVQGHEKWDGRVCVLQVTDTTTTTVQLRALVSASNASAAWDLRVHVREKLIEYLQREHPQCLPRTRVTLAEADSARDEAPA